MQSPKKVKVIILSAFMAFSIVTPHISLGVDFEPGEKDRLMAFVTSQSSFLKKTAWLIVPALISITLGELLPIFLSKRKTEEERERDKIENLILISDAIKNQMIYIKPLCKDKKIWKNMEKEYVSSFSRILGFHDEHLEKYAKKPRGGDRK